MGGVAGLWTCDRCGRSFANKNQAHNCITLTTADYLTGHTEASTATYEAVAAALRRNGPVREHAHKGGIGFISRMTFAGVALRKRWVDLYFLLPRALDHNRVRRLDLYGPSSWAHTVRLDDADQVDDQIEEWLAESLRRGNQETLDPKAVVEPLTASQLQIFWTGFLGRCVARGERVVVRLPTHVGDALELADEIKVRMAGVRYDVRPSRSGGSTFIHVDPTTGLGNGDEIDVYVTGAK